MASYVRDSRIALEVCPIDLLRRLGFRVTLNTDNRLVSGTDMSLEFVHMAEAFGYGPEVFEEFTVAAAEAAFLPLPERRRLIDEVIRPGYAALSA